MADIRRLTATEIHDLIDNAVDLSNDGKDAECEAAVRAVLQHRVSRWQEIYCLALLADCLEDWYKAEEQRYMAETMYGNARFLWPPGKDAAVDERLRDLREQLDETRENQRACRPDNLDEYDDDDWMAQMYQMHSHVIEAEGDWEKRSRARSERIAAEEEAAWHEMERRAQAKSKLDVGQRKEGECDQSENKEGYYRDMELEGLIELNKKWYGTGSDSHTRGEEGSG